MPDADLYQGQIELRRYPDLCRACGADGCRELVDRLQLPPGRRRALELALEAGARLPAVPALTVPRPGPAGLLEVNAPSRGDPVLVTGNSELTQQVLLTVLGETRSPFFVLFCDTGGDTLDMAVVLESFTPERIRQALVAEGVRERAGAATPLTIPGLARGLHAAIAGATGRPVEVGPVCAAELGLYFGARWVAAG
jgi:hypothetical protein